METSKPQHVHYMLYKPFGYLSQFMSNARHEQNKMFLGSLFDFPPGVMPIGRLDKDSEGLLLLTTDGMISHKISTSGVEKEYYVQLDGEIAQNDIKQIIKGITISINGSSYTTKPCEARLLTEVPKFPERPKKIRDARHGPTSWISITIKEGKFRQVRKMTAAIGFPTLRLMRVRVGHLYLKTMQPGDVIKLKDLNVD